ncbi:Glucose-induced degradation protein 8 like protein [Dictyocoela muelleri]|nr:Glucose-induced degradation protein 8 like protein [Dictyocoela muelleri]
MIRKFSNNDLKEIDNLIHIHFICKGYKNISETFSDETSNFLSLESDLDLRDKVRILIESGEINKVIDILNDYNLEILCEPEIRLSLAIHWVKEYINNGMYEEAIDILKEEKNIDDNILTDLLVSLIYKKTNNNILVDRKIFFEKINSQILKMLRLEDQIEKVFEFGFENVFRSN